MKPKEPLKIGPSGSNKKVYFADDGKVTEKVTPSPQIVISKEKIVEEPQIKQHKKKFKDSRKEGEELGTRWYQIYEEHNSNEMIEVKDSEMRSFEEHCKKCFNEELENFQKSKLQKIQKAIFTLNNSLF